MKGKTMPAVLVEVSDLLYAKFLTDVGHWFDANGQVPLGAPAISPVSEGLVKEGNLMKRPWKGPAAAEAAKGVLKSIDPKIHVLISTFLDDPTPKTIVDVSKATGWEPKTFNSYRMLFGKQAWGAGEYLNPVSSIKPADSESGMREFFMTPEAIKAFKAAFGEG